MVQDRCVAVRAWVANVLLSVIGKDQNLAVDLFHQLIQTREELFTTHFVRLLLRRILDLAYDQRIDHILQQMVRSRSPEVATVGSQLACWISLFVSEGYPLAELCYSGTSIQRAGAAEVFAANIGQLHRDSVAEKTLMEYFDDPVKEVRAKASACFTDITSAALQYHAVLVDRFLHSPAFKDNCGHLIKALQKTMSEDPQLIYHVCNNFLKAFGTDITNYRTVAYRESDPITRLVMRAYHRFMRDQDLASQFLDLIDLLVLLGDFGLDEHLSLYDR